MSSSQTTTFAARSKPGPMLVRRRLFSCAGFVCALVLGGCSSSTPSDQATQNGGSGNPASGGSTSSSGGGDQGTPGGGNKGTPGGGSGSGPSPITTPSIPAPDGGKVAEPAKTSLKLSDAPALGEVRYIPNRSSVRLYLPGVDGARDYRVFAVEDGVAVTLVDGAEHVAGGTLHCAGLVQRNQCDDGEILPLSYNTEDLDLPRCEAGGNLDRRPNVPTRLMQTLDVDGVGPDTTLIVEAIDAQCPFPGLFGTQHLEEVIVGTDVGPAQVNVVVNDKSYTLPRWTPTFPVLTQAEIRETHGSMILNGQGPNGPTLDPSSPDFPESPTIRVGHPAPPHDPVVLARAIVKVSSTGTATLPEGFTDKDYFDDFSDDDQPKFVRDTDPTEVLSGDHVNVLQTKKWVLYDVGNQFSDIFVDRGQLNMVMGDPGQGSMSNQAMYPKRPVHLPDAPDTYLHVTYEVQANESDRRYQNIVLCGADQVGQTYDGDFPKAAPLPRPNFMNAPGPTRTNILGWNCLLLIPRGAGYWVLDGGIERSHSDTMLAIEVVDKHPAPKNTNEYDNVRLDGLAMNFGPTQDGTFPQRWVRQMDASGKLTGALLDDQLNVWQRTRFDVFIRRDRVVIYVEGEQRVCQNLTAKPLTMAEGALGFWHVLYHTSAEFTEMRRGLAGDNPRTGQHHILHNVPFADQRSWDNVGFRENVAPPPNFDQSLCYEDTSHK